ncbi:hypothetical protein R3P38DRAFT_2587204, partial [Favolaschia claudopus]
MYEDVARVKGDGHEWTVSADGEAESGLVSDLFAVCVEQIGESEVFMVVALPEGVMALRERFKGEPVYVEVIDALFELDMGTTKRERQRAKHRAAGYFVDGLKLWRLYGGRRDRGRSRRECITRAEAVEMAAKIHAEEGHFGRDAIKLRMMDSVCSPGLDASIVAAV